MHHQCNFFTDASNHISSFIKTLLRKGDMQCRCKPMSHWHPIRIHQVAVISKLQLQTGLIWKYRKFSLDVGWTYMAILW